MGDVVPVIDIEGWWSGDALARARIAAAFDEACRETGFLQVVGHQVDDRVRARAFVFIDGLDEVTSYFEGVEDIAEAVHRVNTEADVVWVDGHSDYGHALSVFWDRYGKDISSKTAVMILGDARNNYHSSQSWIIKEMQHKARKVFWLNPEPRSYWDTGDSIVGEYATYCDGTFEVRNLRQLEAFVENLV